MDVARRNGSVLAGDRAASVGPVVLLNLEKVRITPLYLYWTCAMIVAGFVTNR